MRRISTPSKIGKRLNESDAAVIATADDAILAKLSASSIGYYEDPYLPHMAQKASGLTGRTNNSRFHPIIRKGYYGRVCVIDRAIRTFLSLASSSPSPLQRQVVVLGAGKDTSFLRYKTGLLLGDVNEANDHDNISNQITRWYEVDHPSVILEKKRLLRSLPSSKYSTSVSLVDCDDSAIFEESNEVRSGVFTVNTPDNYGKSKTDVDTLYLVPYDLRDSPSHLFNTLSHHLSFRLDVPTLFVLECVQMYLPEMSSRNLISHISHLFAENSGTNGCALLAIYDPILLHDNFGQIMQNNLTKAMRIPLQYDHDNHETTRYDLDHTPSMIHTRTLEEQLDKVLSCGFHVATGCDMMAACDGSSILTFSQVQKANRCEMLDELEEWILIMKHYSIVVAGCSSTNCNDDEKTNTYGKNIVERFCENRKSEGISLGFQSETSITKRQTSGKQ